MLRTLMQHEVTTNQALTPPHGRPRAPAAALRHAQAQEATLLLAALCSATSGQRCTRRTRGPTACSASREAEAGRVSASRAGGHAPRTRERVARKSASRACFCVTERSRFSFFVPNQRDLGGASAPLGGASCAPGAARRRGPLADGPSRGAQPVGVAPTRCGDHQPAFQRGRGRCAERVDSLRSIRNFVVLVSTAAADRARVTPCPSRISCPEAWRHPGDRPQVADRGRRSRCFSAPGSQRAPAALARRATAADIMCLVVPAGTELRHVELFGGSTAGAPILASCAPHTQFSPRARPTK